MKTIPTKRKACHIAELCTYWISIKITVIETLESATVFGILDNVLTKVVTNNSKVMYNLINDNTRW